MKDRLTVRESISFINIVLLLNALVSLENDHTSELRLNYEFVSIFRYNYDINIYH